MSALESVILDAATSVGADGSSSSVGSVEEQEVITISSRYSRSPLFEASHLNLN